jgi:hypothetical protein
VEPAWLLRGAKVGTALVWPTGKVLGKASGSVFAHMIRNGFTTNGNGLFFGPHDYTAWILGGKAGLAGPKWWIGRKDLQFTVDLHGVAYEEPLDTDTPTSAYDPMDPATFARRYRVGSTRPGFRLGLGGDLAVGAQAEYAYSEFHEDERDASKTISDYALFGGPFLEVGRSRLQLNVVDVGPYFHSPAAQVRQRSVDTSAPPAFGFLDPTALHGRFVLDTLPRPGGVLSAYDRTYDNTFPYGLATPNRKGFGGELDVKALRRDALKVLASVYLLEEVSSNLTINGTQDGFVPVDDPTGVLGIPKRTFTYLNAGPVLDLAPFVGFPRDLEVGANIRMERTSSPVGLLNGLSLLGGVRVRVTSFWESEAAYGVQTSKGRETGLGGRPVARTPYLFENTDLGAYAPFDLDLRRTAWLLSQAIHFGPQSILWLDLGSDLQEGTLNGTDLVPVTVQTVDLLYEVRF